MVEEIGGQRRRNRQGMETRERVLAATILIAAREGHRATTIARITGETGVPASSIFWHFGNKQALIAAAMEYSYRQRRPQVPKWDLCPGAPDRLARLMTNLNGDRTQDGHNHYWLLGLTVAIENNRADHVLRTRFAEMRVESREPIHRWWEAELKHNGVPDNERLVRAALMTNLTLAVLDGRFLRDAIGAPLPDRVTQRLCSGLLHIAESGIAPNAASRYTSWKSPEWKSADVTSRQTLVRAATVVMSKHGLRDATIARICQQAGLPPSSLYWSFKDKGELLAAVVGEGHENAEATLVRCLPDRISGWNEDFSRALLEQFIWIEAEPEMTRIGQLLALQRMEDGDRGRQAYIANRGESTAGVAAWLKRAITGIECFSPDMAQDMAEMTALLTDGLFLGCLLGDLSRPMPDYAPVVLGVLEGSLTAE